jgi:cell division septation protein DedD
MDRPLSLFNAPKDDATSALGTVTLTELGQYAAETEIAPGSGAARSGGKWKVVAGSFDDQNDALVLYDRLRAAGYAAAISPATTNGATIYRVRIAGLPSRADALSLGKRLQATFELAEPGISM